MVLIKEKVMISLITIRENPLFIKGLNQLTNTSNRLF